MTVHLLAWRKSCIKTRKEHKSEFVLKVPQQSLFPSFKWLIECFKIKDKVLNFKWFWRFTGNQGWNLSRFHLFILSFKSLGINLKIKYALPENWKDARGPVWAPSSCWKPILPIQAVCLFTKLFSVSVVQVYHKSMLGLGPVHCPKLDINQSEVNANLCRTSASFPMDSKKAQHIIF